MSNSNYAGFWLRFVAYLIDTIVVQILQSFIVLPFLAFIGLGIASEGFFNDFNSMNEEEIIGMAIAFVSAVSTFALLATALQILYFSIMEASKFQGTLGKMALGLVVTDMEGKPIDFPKALLRNLGKIISGMLLLIGYIMAGLTEKKQALHDMIASTLVVKK
jgi:uncharacterized RDD family membrane protein YckC